MTDSTTGFLAPDALPDALTVAEFHLEVIEGPDTGRRVGPLSPPVRIGSAPGNDLVLNDPTVSRHHCALERRPDGLVIRDAESRNGTVLGTVRVREAWLSPDATFRLGQTVVAVRPTRTRPLDISLSGHFGGLFGGHLGMRALFALLTRLAEVDTAVLVEGETGTGKELVARALHTESRRARGRFVVVDCGAVAANLIESELFGHVRGAFTGADGPRTGAFELADAGTLFLDEIGELPLELQPKLLRALETGTVRPLGSAQEKRVSPRIVAATHRDLRRMVNVGTFREDLYYRLAVCPVWVPPLRERREDVPALARLFLARFQQGPGTPVERAPVIAPDAAAWLSAQPWPGNVRELRNAVERAVILGQPAATARGDLLAALRVASGRGREGGLTAVSMEAARETFERAYLLNLLARHGPDLDAAAREADLHPKSLARLLRRYEISRL
jgi:transcriptional regulator with GAF, ATPase, and Fis domain